MESTYQNRYLRITAQHSSSLQTTTSAPYELNEDDVLWNTPYDNPPSQIRRQASLPKASGIKSLFPESTNHSILFRKPSASKPIPRPPGEGEVSGPPKANQSAPFMVPILSAAAARERRNRYADSVWDEKWDGEGDEEMLPPHEIVARKMRLSQRTAHSVLEGAGRTLKGRDLRQVRNAVWQRTGFLD